MTEDAFPGLAMPAEWRPQSAIWLAWPHNVETWPENLAAAQSEFVLLAKTIAPTQQVFVLAGKERHVEAERQLGSVPGVSIVSIPTNDAWARDYAPTFVKSPSGELVAIDWHYNAWGGKYPPFDADQLVASRIAEFLGIDSVSTDLCFEGGAIEINDSGVLISTTTCALNPNRNPEWTRERVEKTLRRCLGASKFIWLANDPIEGDDTDGHIDQLARFIDDQTIVYASVEDEKDPQRSGLAKNLNDLKQQLVDHRLSDYRLIPLLMPGPIEFCGRRIPASYCNFLIANELVLVPQFNQPEDDLAIEVLKPLFPKRKVIGLPSLNLSVGLGSFHCLSQQQPL